MNPFLHSTVARPQTVPQNISSGRTSRPAKSQPVAEVAKKQLPTPAPARTPPQASPLTSSSSVPAQFALLRTLPSQSEIRRSLTKAAGLKAFLAAGLLTGMLAGVPAPLQASSPPPPGGINVNIATMTELLTIKGIGPKTAALIISERERAGPYVSFQDFAERIKGIGPKRAAALREAGVRVSSSPPPIRP